MTTSKWNISIGTPVGEIPAVLDFVEDGTALSGTLTDPNGANEIRDARVENGSYIFDATLKGPTGPTKVTFTLKPDGDSISGKVKMSVLSIKVSGTRAQTAEA